MVGTFIGPGGIYMALSGAVNKVFGLETNTALIVNLVPLILFMVACYYTDSKFQLALAKLLTLGYTLIMLAVYVGLMVEVEKKGAHGNIIEYALLDCRKRVPVCDGCFCLLILCSSYLGWLIAF